MATTNKQLRDEFAMSALTGMLAYSHLNPMRGNYHENCTPQGVASAAYEYANEMLEARENVRPPAWVEGTREPRPGEIDAHFREQLLAAALEDVCISLSLTIDNIRVEMTRSAHADSRWDGVPELLTQKLDAARNVLNGLNPPTPTEGSTDEQGSHTA